MDYIEIAEKELAQAEEYLDIDMCDDGLVFHHLKNAAENYLRALATDFNVDVSNLSSINEIVDILQNKTTIKFPDFINDILEMDETFLSTGCSTSVCFDMDFYGDIYESVKKLREFVIQTLEE